MLKNKYDILICNDNEMELPVHIVDTIEEASIWLGCKRDTLYKSKYLSGYMNYNGYKIELIKREV
jgi:hypothetical protein